MKMQSYFWEKFITKSHVTFCHYSLFCTKSVGCAQTITHEKEKNNNKKTWLCHWSCLDHVLSIKTFTEKKLLCLRLFEYLGLTINGALHSHNTCFPRNLGQRAFAWQVGAVYTAVNCRKVHWNTANAFSLRLHLWIPPKIICVEF